jgi:aromatic-L-amino-acid decarboxylase
MVDETAAHSGHRFSWHPEPALLDPRAEGARAALAELGSRTWDLALDYLYDEALVRPVGPDSYPELRGRFFGPTGRPGPAPAGPSTAEAVLEEARARLLPYMFNSQHPASFSYFTPPPLTMSIAGEVLAQWFHQGIDVFQAGPAGALIEEEVTSWLRELVGFDAGGWGVLTSGGVMANVMALTVARDRHLGRLLGSASDSGSGSAAGSGSDGGSGPGDGSGHGDGRSRPPRGGELDRARVYASEQTHFSIGRALDVLGFPSESLRVVESDERFCLRGDAVRAAVGEDRAAGLLPFCVAAVSGSTNTGSVDRVDELAEVCTEEQLWLHVDAAYGGAVRLSGRDAARVTSLELADSITIDPHKWFFQAYDIGALIVRRREDLHATFSRAPEYYRSTRPEDKPLNWLEYSIEGTRRLRALKLWMSWKHIGSDGLGRLVEMNNDIAALLSEKIAASDDFEAVLPEPELSVVCFRHLPGDIGAGGRGETDAARLDRHQDLLQRALEVSGEAWVSTTRLRGATYLRAGIMNPLTTEADLDRLLSALRRLAPAAAAEAGL